jgi:aromatase
MSLQTPSAAADPDLITVGHTDNWIDIDADPAFVFAFTNDVTTWPDLFTEYAAAEVLERDGQTVTFRLSMHPDENGTVWSWVSQRTTDPEAGTAVAHRVETGPFDHMDIQWFYTPSPDGTGTRMRWVQDFAMKPAAPIDTAGMTVRINRNSKIQMSVIKEKTELAARAAVPVTEPAAEPSGTGTR